MSIHLENFEATLASLREKAEGDALEVLRYVEAASQHMRNSHVETLVKDAVHESLKNAVLSIGNLINNTAAAVAQEATAVAATTEKVVRKAASRKQTTTF
jgi:hypothetical protein